MLAAVSEPYADRPEYARFTLPPQPGERVSETFCGT